MLSFVLSGILLAGSLFDLTGFLTEDPCKNIGIRMVYRMAKDIRYQNILGLNVLTIKL